MIALLLVGVWQVRLWPNLGWARTQLNKARYVMQMVLEQPDKDCPGHAVLCAC